MAWGIKSLVPWFGRYGGPSYVAPQPRGRADYDPSLWQITVGSDAVGWRDISSYCTVPTYSEVHPGGTASITFAILADRYAIAFNELAPDQQVKTAYAGVEGPSGFILPRSISYQSESASRQQLIQIAASGVLARAKRRQDFAHVWTDVDLTQWSADPYQASMSPGIYVTNQGTLRFACASGSVFPAGAMQRWVYWMHQGLSLQDIDHVSFTWQSSGELTWYLWEATSPLYGDWTQVATGGGASTLATDASVNITAGKQAIGIGVAYVAEHTLAADEWVEFGALTINGQAGDFTVYDAIADALVTTGLATSSVVLP